MKATRTRGHPAADLPQQVEHARAFTPGKTGSLCHPHPQLLGWGEITEPSPADTTLWFPPKEHTSTQSQSGFPWPTTISSPSLPSFGLPKNPERTAVPLEVLGRRSRGVSTSLGTLTGVSAVPALSATAGTHSHRGLPHHLLRLYDMDLLPKSPFQINIRKFPFSQPTLQASRTYPSKSL